MAATGYRGRARFAPGERSEKSAAVHTSLDEAGALINSVHAKVLSDVIRAKDWNIHRDFDGFSALRDWLTERFDFHVRIAADLAAIARLSKKFGHLAEAATTGAARIDQVAYAVRQLEKTPAMRLYARTPYREPVASPFAPAVSCPTPEHLVAEYCAHASFAELKAHLAEMEASLAEHAEILDDLSEQSLQRLEVWQTETGMWALSGLLSSTTGHMLDKLLQTAVPPPRQDETDADRVLPAAANRNAEALHHMLGVYAADPKAAKRHGETCRLHLAVDVETLQGKDTGRTPALEGRPISLELARLLACEAQVVPMVFDYGTGEAIELGRAERLPNTALRRKLVAEQPSGCAWKGCGRPAVQCEAHHIRPWWAGGETSAENLILLCRFHHGRVHTPGWTVTKTAPGRALIVHHEGHEERLDTEAGTGCGCADWRSAEDLDAEFADDVANVFPTGLFPEEWGPSLREDLEQAAEAVERERIEAEIRAARARLRKKFAAPKSPTASEPVPDGEPASESGPVRDRRPDREREHASIPVLIRPSREALRRGGAYIRCRARKQTAFEPLPMSRTRNHPTRPKPNPRRRTPTDHHPSGAPSFDSTETNPDHHRRDRPPVDEDAP